MYYHRQMLFEKGSLEEQWRLTPPHKAGVTVLPGTERAPAAQVKGTDSLQSKPALLETCTLLSLLCSYSHLVLETRRLRRLCCRNCGAGFPLPASGTAFRVPSPPLKASAWLPSDSAPSRRPLPCALRTGNPGSVCLAHVKCH